MAEQATLTEITEIFAEIINLCEALDVSRLNELPGCWEYQLDEQWHIALNGHKEPTKCSSGFAVTPFHCYVEWGGLPAGEVSPFSGFIAAGSAANEDTFIEALKRATVAANGRKHDETGN